MMNDASPSTAENKPVTESKISRTMLMGDIVSRFPETVDIMLAHGLHCIGCDVSYTESLQDGCASHGMSEEDIDALVNEMNGVVSPTVEGKVVQLTTKAAEKIKELMKAEHKEGAYLRVGFVKGGCSGYSYVLDFEQNKLSDDVELTEEGINVIMRPDAKDTLNGLKIDYRDGLKGAGFKIVNPNAKHHCGCGSSFS